MNPLLPLAVLVPGGLGLLLALTRKGQAQAPAPSSTADAADQLVAHQDAAQSAAQDALAAQSEHDTAIDATDTAMQRAAAADRQVAESSQAAQQAAVAVQAAQQAVAAAPNDPAALSALAAAQAAHDREVLAANQASAEATAQKQQASTAAKAALAAKAKKAAAVAKVASSQAAAHAIQKTITPPSTQTQALVLAATALRDFLVKNPTPAAFGVKGAPSAPVLSFQRVATKYGHPLQLDGIVGPKTRAVAELAGVALPTRPAPGTAHAAPPAAPTTHAAVPVTVPPGYDPARAKLLAAQVVANMRKLPAAHRFDYDRNLLKAFQTAAAIVPDGVYGGGTRGALLYYGQQNAPKPLFAPLTTGTYHPPG